MAAAFPKGKFSFVRALAQVIQELQVGLALFTKNAEAVGTIFLLENKLLRFRNNYI